MTNRFVLMMLIGLALQGLLAACGGSPTVAEIAPLDSDRPTFVYFYTDS